MNGQPSQGGIASIMGGMGGSPALGGAPQMPQVGAQKPPQQSSQPGQLDPKLIDALAKIAALKVKQDEAAAREKILAAIDPKNSGTVVEQLDAQNMEATKKELVDKLSGGIKQSGQQSAQPQGQPSPMGGGIAAAPGANQAAEPQAMASGGIIAFEQGAGGNGDMGAIKTPEEQVTAPPMPAAIPPKTAAPEGLGALLATHLKKQAENSPEDAAKREREAYKKLTAVDPKLAQQLADDMAAQRKALVARSTKEPDVYEKLRAFANVAPVGGQTWTMAGAQGAGNITNLENEAEAKRMDALSGLTGLSKAEYDKQQATQKELYGVGTTASKTAQESLDKAITNLTHTYSSDSTLKAAREQNISQEQIARDRNASALEVQKLHNKALAAGRFDLGQQMLTEINAATTPAQIKAITDKFSNITGALKFNSADTKGEYAMAQAAFTSWLTSKEGRKATPQQVQDKMNEFMPGGGGGGPPNVPPVGAVKRIGG
jgi:hypothetical protein